MEIIPREILPTLFPEVAHMCESDAVITNGSLVCIENAVVLIDRLPLVDIFSNTGDILRNQGFEMKAVFRNIGRLAEALELYRQGMPVSEIMDRLGIRSFSALYRVLPNRRRKVSTRRRVSRDEVARICQLRWQGYSIYRISKETGRAFSTVKYVIDRYCRDDSR